MVTAILGPLRITGADGEDVEISGARLRALLTRLALEPGHPGGSRSTCRPLPLSPPCRPCAALTGP